MALQPDSGVDSARRRRGNINNAQQHNAASATGSVMACLNARTSTLAIPLYRVCARSRSLCVASMAQHQTRQRYVPAYAGEMAKITRVGGGLGKQLIVARTLAQTGHLRFNASSCAASRSVAM